MVAAEVGESEKNACADVYEFFASALDCVS